MSFIHLHTHSDYSLLQASLTISQMVNAAVQNGMSALALTDDGTLFGAIEFYKACKNANIKPIIGVDFFIAPHSRFEKTTNIGKRASRIVLLAQNNEGYHALIRLSSQGYTEGFYYRPRIDKELIEQESAHLIALSGGMGGEIPQLIIHNRMSEAIDVALWYKKIFGDRFYLELTDHGITEQKIIGDALKKISVEHNIPLVASNDIYYLNKDDADAHDVLLCIGNKRKKNEEGRFRFSTQEFYFKSEEEMYARFADIPEAIQNTEKIAHRCSLEIDFPGPLLPNYDIPSEFSDAHAYLHFIAQKGLQERYTTITEELQARLTYELDIIINMGFTGYFLIVWDFIAYAKHNNIPVGPGRGSGAGSLVAYSLYITDIDPMRYHLLFERFLNPERISMPDFDIDFCFEMRQKVIDYVTQKYGTHRVSQIITFGTLKAKAVLRDVARVLDMNFTDADRIAKLIPDDLKITLQRALNEEAKLKELYDTDIQVKELIDISLRLENLHRHASTHAAGLVISQEALTQYAPLFRDAKTGAISTQFTMNYLEDCGLVKMDFLGLKTLTIINHAITLIQKYNSNFSITNIPIDDDKTFAMLSRGDSSMVFQFESAGMQKVLCEVCPSSIEDLIALNALYRPGPMDNIPKFIAHKKNPIAIKYLHPWLEPILRETYGVIVYQEQVMEIVQVIAGFSLGQADIIRRAMGKKKTEDMKKLRIEFVAGAIEKGVEQKVAQEIFDLLIPFSGYGFNKSHAAAYSVLAYQTAYLRAHYPRELYAAALSNEMTNPKRFAILLTETRDNNIYIASPSIDHSDKLFTIAHERIIFGLQGIKGIGSAVVEHILHERNMNGNFISIYDFLERVDLSIVNKKVMEQLILSGCFDEYNYTRHTLIHNLEKMITDTHSSKADKMSGQESLFDDDEVMIQQTSLEECEEYAFLDKLEKEKECMGFYISGHPLDAYQKLWERSTSLKLHYIEEMIDNKQYAIIAFIREIFVMETKDKKLMGRLIIEDYHGHIEAICFAKEYTKFQELLEEGVVLGFTGILEGNKQRGEQKQLLIKTVCIPDELPHVDAHIVHIMLHYDKSDEENLLNLAHVIENNKGNSLVQLHIHTDYMPDVIIRASANFTITSIPEILELLQKEAVVQKVWCTF